MLFNFNRGGVPVFSLPNLKPSYLIVFARPIEEG